MAVTITKKGTPVDRVVLLTRDDWGRVGRLARERIIRRTQSGRDETGAAFPPYSPGYLKTKLGEGGTATVDLQLSGEMLRAIAVEPDDSGVTLRFNR